MELYTVAKKVDSLCCENKESVSRGCGWASMFIADGVFDAKNRLWNRIKATLTQSN